MSEDDRSSHLSGVRRVLVKIGSAVLTHQTKRGLELDNLVVESLVAQISELHDRDMDIVLVSSGAVAAGRGVICMSDECPDIHGLPDRQAASAVGQSRLMHAYDQAFALRGKVSAQILLTRDDLQSRRRYLNARNTFGALLEWRAIPVVNENDTVVVRELEFGDNDHLASLLLNLVEADLFVNLTSAKGVFTKNPDQHPDAEPLSCISDIASLNLNASCGGKTTVGSGGMYSKLLAARRAARLGVPTLIVSGREPQALIRAINGENIGTWVTPEKKSMSRRKFWLAYNREPSGSIYVDDGAVRALRERGKSLLPIGITDVRGNFARGAVVRILTEDGGEVAIGMANYRAAELRRIMGLKTDAIEAVLGPGLYSEAVHRDNMVVDCNTEKPEDDTAY
ncbi:glutamate 5-kinase [Oceanidesulfovibrio marinus]|uniref:Glutamate 5-kinase n=1 Tax=Oceanidesulfovibrio marinus TaxID=370038 RepID=A0A6P1ZGX7_9BACT|nr:glutamate 5-kinase [Oceanidesulfovibrio marinus]QJT10677.1 glutamate 5-kinase [Oceanidesulfovibrio marinus]TVM34098.1 glutamate 5-kinase [Oceanidesulfovibrio marinus]